MTRQNFSKMTSNTSVLAVNGRTKQEEKFEDKQAEEVLSLRRNIDHHRMISAKEPVGPTRYMEKSKKDTTGTGEVKRHASVVRSASLRQGLHMGEPVLDGVNNIRVRASQFSQISGVQTAPAKSTEGKSSRNLAMSLLRESSSFLSTARDKTGFSHIDPSNKPIPKVQDDFEGLHWLLHRIVVHSKHFAKHIKRLHELKESQDSRMKRELKRLVSCSLEDYIETYHDLLDEEELNAAEARHRRNAGGVASSKGKFETDKSSRPGSGTKRNDGNDQDLSGSGNGNEQAGGAGDDLGRNRNKNSAPHVIELTDDAIEEARYGNDWDIKSAKQTVLTNVSKAITKNQRLHGQMAKLYARSMWTSIHEKSYQKYRSMRMGQANLKAVCTPSVMMANFLCLQDFRKAQELAARRLADAEARKKELAKKKEQELLFPVATETHDEKKEEAKGEDEQKHGARRKSVRAQGPLIPLEEELGRRGSVAEERARTLRFDAIRGFLAKNAQKANQVSESDKMPVFDSSGHNFVHAPLDASTEPGVSDELSGNADSLLELEDGALEGGLMDDPMGLDEFRRDLELENNEHDDPLNPMHQNVLSPSHASKANKSKLLERHIEQRLREWQYERELNKTLGFDNTMPLPGCKTKQRKVRSILGLTREEEETAKMMIAAFIVSRHEKQVKVYMHEREVYLKKRMAKQKRFVTGRHERIAKEYNMKLIREKFQTELVRTKRRLHRLDVKKEYLIRYQQKQRDVPALGHSDGEGDGKLKDGRMRMDSIRRKFGINQRGIDVERTKEMARDYSIKVRTKGGGWKPHRSKDIRKLKQSTLQMQRIFRGHVARVYAWAMGWLLDPVHLERIFHRYKSSPSAEGIADPQKFQQLLKDLGRNHEEEEYLDIWKDLSSLEIVGGRVVPKRKNASSLHSSNPTVKYQVFHSYFRSSRNRDLGVAEMLRFSQIAKAQRKRENAESRSRGRESKMNGTGDMSASFRTLPHHSEGVLPQVGSPAISDNSGSQMIEKTDFQHRKSSKTSGATKGENHSEVLRRSANQAARDYLTVRRLHREQRTMEKQMKESENGGKQASQSKMSLGDQLELAGHYALRKDQTSKSASKLKKGRADRGNRPHTTNNKPGRSNGKRGNRGGQSANKTMRKRGSGQAHAAEDSDKREKAPSRKPHKRKGSFKFQDIHHACEELRKTDDFQRREEINRELFQYLQKSRTKLQEASRQLWTDKNAALKEVLGVMRDTNGEETKFPPADLGNGRLAKTHTLRDYGRSGARKGGGHADSQDELKQSRNEGTGSQPDAGDGKHWSEKMKNEDATGMLGQSNSNTVVKSSKSFAKEKESAAA